MIGISLGGNYVLRYLLKNKRKSVTSLSLIAAPFDIKFVIDNMNSSYQKYFIKYYISATVERHEQMKFWWDNSIIDLKELK
jgi:predicted alpha/beta-fold hydrolase